MRSAADFEIFDAHHHVGTLASYNIGESSASILEETARTRLSHMDRHGIGQALLMPGSNHGEAVSQNHYVGEYRDLHPERFPAAVGSVNPFDGYKAVAETYRCIKTLSFRGMVRHSRFHGMVLDHPLMYPLLEVLRELDVPTFVHVIAELTLELPWRLQNLADTFPDVKFVALDAFSSPNQVGWMFYIAKKHPNIYFETAVMMSLGHRLDEFVKINGADRLILGTDCYEQPFYQTPFPINELLASSIGDADLKKIFSGNLRQLLKL